METFNQDISRIACGTRFTGELATRSDLRIDGEFEGKLYCSGRLVVGESGVVKGTVIGHEVEFSGTMESGSFFVKDALSLKSGSVVDGDIFSHRLQVELGARFVGSSKMLDDEKYAKAAAPFASLLPEQSTSLPASEAVLEPSSGVPGEETAPETVSPAEPEPADSRKDKSAVDSMSESWRGWNKKRS